MRRGKMSSNRFLDALRAEGSLPHKKLEEVRTESGGDASVMLEKLLNQGLPRRWTLGKAWGDSVGVSYVELSKTLFQREAVQSLPVSFAREHCVMPIYRMGSIVTVAVSDPGDMNVLTMVESVIGGKVSPVFAFRDEIEEAIEIQYESVDAIEELFEELRDLPFLTNGEAITEASLCEAAGAKSVVRLARGLVLLALRERASDIHIEPGEHSVRVRLRVDGVLREYLRIEHALMPPLLSRLKIQGGMDITEHRRPQDGRFEVKLGTRSVDVRMSCVPTIHNEKVVLRILGQTDGKGIPSLEQLGVVSTVREQLDRVVANPHGIVFVTGPTGSGKSTTLFSILQEMNHDDVNIVTVEDPVEYRLEGLNQVQVRPEIGLDFASGMRALLRQDPDVILVGEIRDPETAKMAAQAALTGHLVLATMHTNTAIQAIVRLAEVGVEPFLIAPSVIGVIGQRLVRRICESCKESYSLSQEEISELFLAESSAEVEFYRGGGCDECRGTGYSGRIALHEIVVVDDELRRLVAQGASTAELNQAATNAGFKPLYYDGLRKVLMGLTTIREVYRVAAA